MKLNEAKSTETEMKPLNDTFLAALLAPATPTTTAPVDPLAAGYSCDGKPAAPEMIEMLASLIASRTENTPKPAATFGPSDAGVVYGGDMEDVF